MSIKLSTEVIQQPHMGRYHQCLSSNQGRLLTQYLELNDKGNYQCTLKSQSLNQTDGHTREHFEYIL